MGITSRLLTRVVSSLLILAWASTAYAVNCADYKSEVNSFTPSVYLRLGDAGGGTTALNEPGTPNGTWASSGSPPHGGTSLITGDADTCFTANGSDASFRVTYPNDARTAFSGSITWCAWIKTSATFSAAGVVWSNWAAGAGDRWDLEIQTTGKARAFVNDASPGNVNFYAESAGTINDGTHHLLCGKYTVAGGVCLYVDGTKTCNTSSTPSFTPDGGDTSGFQVNGFVGGSSNQFTAPGSGQIDEVVFFQSELTDQNVQDMYDAGNTGCVSATATFTPTATPTPTPTSTATPTPTPTRTPTNTPASTATRTHGRRHRFIGRRGR